MTLTAELKKYCRDILKDKSLSCVKHKWSCQRFLCDLERSKKDDFDYEFIPAKAQRFFEWCTLFKHRKGVLAGQYIELDPILKFIFGNIYGWYHKVSGYRRFDRFYWQVARKNAKSQMLSLVASYELIAFCETGEEAQEVYCAATKSEQAKIVFNETKGMLERCKELKGVYKVAYNNIFHNKSDSFMRVLSEEDRKTGDGLNPQCGIIDEYHAHDTAEMYDIIESGMGARAQPLLAIITTAGFNLNHPCYRIEYQLISKILNPDIPLEMDNYFVMVNELDKDENGELIDDIKDPNVWIKANPIICTYSEGRENLLKAMKLAIEDPEKMRNFLTKRMNVWIHLTLISYMNMVRWAKCGTDNLPNLMERNVYVGIDFSSKIDLSSVSFSIPVDDKYIILSHSFMPEETFDRKCKTDKVPYGLWKSQGWLTIQPGPIVDYKDAIAYIREQADKYKWYIREWCLDPWCAGQIMSWLIDDGEEVVEIRQGARTLSEPTKDFRDMVLVERIIHNNNPLLTWTMSNAVIDKVDRNENVILNKSKSPQRIDPVAATINAHVRSMHSDLNSEPTILMF